MEFKPDWPQACERFEAWWAGEVMDRVALQVTSPRDGCQDADHQRSTHNQWTDVARIVETAEERMRVTFYGGEAFPVYFPNLGPDVFSAYLGSELVFDAHTSWAEPIIMDWDDMPDLRFDRNNRWWKLTLELIDQGMTRAPQRYFVGLTDLHGGMDALAALRGREQLCVDLIERPDAVKDLMRNVITPLWFEIYDGMYQRSRGKQTGTSTWLTAWSPGKWYPTSCDFAALISPDMFDEFVLPDITEEVLWLDRSLYHLDGPDAVRHLDSLLKIPDLGGIQWVPGAGAPPMTEWIPLLKRVQKAGKLLHLSIKADEVEPLLKTLSARGLMLSTQCATETEARRLLSDAETWTRGV
ncbi:MAG: hypothetical protein HOH43_06470 [Candidatus Latescibacteria bacterium]|nr:hypothetical protein [Candidatus Latescibacterota bacterium]